MKKNIFSILTLIILFTVSFISSAASSVKLISSGDENNVFETTGTLRIEWKEGDDCDYRGLIKMYFMFLYITVIHILISRMDMYVKIN